MNFPLDESAKVALLTHGQLAGSFGKLAEGMLRYGRAQVVAIVDRELAGCNPQDYLPRVRYAPIVSTVDEAKRLGAEILIIGIAPPGGMLPQEWRDEIRHALEIGFSLVNPLHARMENDPFFLEALQKGRWILDIRVEPPGLKPGTGAARLLDIPRILSVGTDMTVGKMTATIELHNVLRERGWRSVFVATGQVGLCISGRGVAIDAVRVDYAAGAIESEVMNASKDADVILVEGQGSLCHPAASANLALLRGAMPTHLLMVARAKQETIRFHPWVRIPPLKALIGLYQDLSEACGVFPRPNVIGIALNTSLWKTQRLATSSSEHKTKRNCLLQTRFVLECKI
ncbi:MAG TPA: DUF1611 domain-containing protein [Fimbriimonadales bacterium]|nr:DUF1611 domain-containing protein [Fimbriimonadales bacterium]